MDRDNERDWDEAKSDCDGVYYHRECCVCGNSFYGFKSRIFCQKCHETHKTN